MIKTSKDENMSKRNFSPIHPGEILVTEFLEPKGITQYRLAKEALADRLDTEVHPFSHAA